MKILHLMKGHEDQSVFFLPPRAPGERLPKELTDAYEGQCKSTIIISCNIRSVHKILSVLICASTFFVDY